MHFTVKDLLKMEVTPALGCTEPAAIALGAAAAASLLGDEKITAIEIWVDANIYKNGVAVAIPGTGGLCGLDLASAPSALGGDPTLRLAEFGLKHGCGLGIGKALDRLARQRLIEKNMILAGL